MMRNSGWALPAGASFIRTTTPPAEVSSRARALDTLGGLRVVEVGAAFDELPHHGICRALDLVDGPHTPHATVVQHGDARPDAIGAAHVVRDDDARDAQSVAHAD